MIVSDVKSVTWCRYNTYWEFLENGADKLLWVRLWFWRV